MLLKARTVPDDLQILRYLNVRMELSEQDKYRYRNLERGYEGEVKFDQLMESHLEERFIINDLLLKINNSLFQFDTVTISQDGIQLIDVKNFQHDCFYDSDKFFNVTTNREYQNPIVQLKRSQTLFRQLLQTHKLNYLVDASVIFINPEFTLYQAPMNLPIVLPGQVKRFIKKYNQIPSKLHDGHRELAQKLISLHQPKNPFVTLPVYHYSQLRKGIYCETCGSFQVIKSGHYFICKSCSGAEKTEHAILRNVKEFTVLFPDKTISTKGIADWCKDAVSKKTISRILRRHFSICGSARESHFKKQTLPL